MQITVFNGSPRGEHGNTHWMVRELASGAEEAGARVENIFLADFDIRQCKGCFTCWKKASQKCVIPDDAAELVAKIPASDIVVFATPVYVDNVTGLMKTFMDRMILLGDPHFEMDDSGEYRHVRRAAKSPRLVVVSNCGFPEQSHFQVLSLLFKRVARNMQTEVIAEIYRGAGELLASRNPLVMPFLLKYKRLLRKAGREIVELGGLSEETRNALDKPLVPHKHYIAGANKYWDKCIRESNEK